MSLPVERNFRPSLITHYRFKCYSHALRLSYKVSYLTLEKSVAHGFLAQALDSAAFQKNTRITYG